MVCNVRRAIPAAAVFRHGNRRGSPRCRTRDALDTGSIRSTARRTRRTAGAFLTPAARPTRVASSRTRETVDSVAAKSKAIAEGAAVSAATAALSALGIPPQLGKVAASKLAPAAELYASVPEASVLAPVALAKLADSLFNHGSHLRPETPVLTQTARIFGKLAAQTRDRRWLDVAAKLSEAATFYYPFAWWYHEHAGKRPAYVVNTKGLPPISFDSTVSPVTRTIQRLREFAAATADASWNELADEVARGFNVIHAGNFANPSARIAIDPNTLSPQELADLERTGVVGQNYSRVKLATKASPALSRLAAQIVELQRAFTVGRKARAVR